ncbi:hypothetical protein APHAL10511_008418 [Amanita phalloides]|nr:hypothetical protein APHAL10511_008418 [Amanita phalloides]
MVKHKHGVDLQADQADQLICKHTVDSQADQPIGKSSESTRIQAKATALNNAVWKQLVPGRSHKMAATTSLPKAVRHQKQKGSDNLNVTPKITVSVPLPGPPVKKKAKALYQQNTEPDDDDPKSSVTESDSSWDDGTDHDIAESTDSDGGKTHGAVANPTAAKK